MTPEFFKNNACNIIVNDFEAKVDVVCDMFYSYGIISKIDPEQIVIFNNHQTFFDLYAENKYHLIDPVVTTAFHRINGFSWDKNFISPLGEPMPEIFEIAMNYNIDCGYSLIVHDPSNHIAVFSVMTNSSKRNQLKNLIQGKGSYLQNILISTHQKILSAYRDTVKKDNILSFYKNETFRRVDSAQNHSTPQLDLIKL